MLPRRARRVSARGRLDVQQDFKLPQVSDLYPVTLTRLDRWARFGFQKSLRRVLRWSPNFSGTQPQELRRAAREKLVFQC